MANGRTMDVVAIELEERPPGALFFEAAHFEAAAAALSSNGDPWGRS